MMLSPPLDKHQATHFSVNQTYSPNCSPDPNAYQEAKPLINASAWDEDDFDGLKAKAQRTKRLRIRIALVAGFVILIGLGGPLAWHNTSSDVQERIKNHLAFPPLGGETTAALSEASHPLTSPASTAPDLLDHQNTTDTTPPDGYLVTRPALPVAAQRPPSDQERFIAYLPHSGYHNQRIEITNAILMGMMLNRTVLIPYVRLGQAQGWRPKDTLQQLWDRDQKTEDKIAKCTPFIDALEAGSQDIDASCKDYTKYAQFSWSMLVDLQRTLSTVPLVARPDLRFEWLTSEEGLNVPEESIHRIADPSQYEYKYFASSEIDTQENIGNYNERINIESLMSPEIDAKRIIEFGSLYGSYRINLQGADARWPKALGRIMNAMVFNIPEVEQVADDIRARMGGRENHLGFHLRVGDGAFQRAAIPHMQDAYRKVMTSIFGFKAAKAEELLAAAQAQGPLVARRDSVVQGDDGWSWLEAEDASSSELGPPPEQPPTDWDVDDEFIDDHLPVMPAYAFTLPKRQASAPQNLVQCRGPLHKDPELLVLNAHVYIATDAHQPLSDVALAPFFRTFPCAHVLDDFQELPSLQAMRRLRSMEEGIKAAHFLTPILESVMAAGSVRVMGTHGSTFSRFVVSTLHLSYWKDAEERRLLQAALLQRLRDGTYHAPPPV